MSLKTPLEFVLRCNKNNGTEQGDVDVSDPAFVANGRDGKALNEEVLVGNLTLSVTGGKASVADDLKRGDLVVVSIRSATEEEIAAAKPKTPDATTDA